MSADVKPTSVSMTSAYRSTIISAPCCTFVRECGSDALLCMSLYGITSHSNPQYALTLDF